jgi:hypothetical protein
MIGGDTTQPMQSSTPGSYPMRANPMGDVINSNPAVLVYQLSGASGNPVLNTALGAARANSAADPASVQFRVIFVSANSGNIHAFGEVSYAVPATSTANLQVYAAATELWSFIPTEAMLNPNYLDNVDYTNTTNAVANPHVYMADGSPFIYWLNQPTATAPAGTGYVGGSDTAFLIVGMGKAGRSTYCLNVKNPFTPTLEWVLRPDDQPATGGNTLVSTMGLSTSTPAVARAVTGGYVHDYVTLGGGFSNSDIETGWTGAIPGGGTTPAFGRSMLMFDVFTGPGNVQAAQGNITSWTASDMASVPAGTMPFEYYQGTNMTQRIYFTDRAGHIYAVGNTATNGSGTRTGMDTSVTTNWNLRHVMSPSSTTVISTLPQVYQLANGTMPGASLPAVGVVYGTGDRNNPMDWPSGAAACVPGSFNGKKLHRLGIVFDTNTPSMDSTGVAESSQLADLTSVSTAAAANPSTYLGVNAAGRPSEYGWAITFPMAGNYYTKIINNALVQNDVLFFSAFTPTTSTNACAGAGVTNSYREARAESPIFANGTQLTAAASFNNSNWVTSSGELTAPGANGTQTPFNWKNLASDISALGNTQALQVGQDNNASGTGTEATLVQVQGRGIPRGVRLRAWRVIR